MKHSENKSKLTPVFDSLMLVPIECIDESSVAVFAQQLR